MISTGVVRKIDDLGRIVIPKEIRRTLGIRDGETLEIVVEDNNIRLTKKNMINNYISDIKEIVDLTSLVVTGDIIITNRDKVIVTNSKLVRENDLLPSKLINMIDERLSYKDSKVEEYNIGNNNLNGYFLI